MAATRASLAHDRPGLLDRAGKDRKRPFRYLIRRRQREAEAARQLDDMAWVEEGPQEPLHHLRLPSDHLRHTDHPSDACAALSTARVSHADGPKQDALARGAGNAAAVHHRSDTPGGRTENTA